jgi:GxxExxY protein
VGACFAVCNDMGHAFTEPIYHECLEIELAGLGMPFLSKPPLTLTCRERTLCHSFIPDFVCSDLEIKAVSTFKDKHRAEVIYYVHGGNFALGSLVKFGSFPKVQFERLLPKPRPPVQSTEEIDL